MDQNNQSPEPQAPEPQSEAKPPRRSFGGLGRAGATAFAVAGLVGGGAIAGYAISHAASNSTPAAAVATDPSSSPSPGASGAGKGHHGDRGADRQEDLQTAAAAIGISDTQLKTELSGGKSIAQVAQAHNVDPQKVIDALVAAENKEIDAAVSSGKLTPAQADKAKSKVTQHVQAQVNAVGGKDHGSGRGHDRSQEQQVVADAIGISTTQLSTELTSGKSIAQVAQAHNVDPQKVIDALVAADTKKVDAAVASGKLTPAQADQIKAKIQQHVKNEVNETHGQAGG